MGNVESGHQKLHVAHVHRRHLYQALVDFLSCSRAPICVCVCVCLFPSQIYMGMHADMLRCMLCTKHRHTCSETKMHRYTYMYMYIYICMYTHSLCIYIYTHTYSCVCLSRFENTRDLTSNTVMQAGWCRRSRQTPMSQTSRARGSQRGWPSATLPG